MKNKMKIESIMLIIVFEFMFMLGFMLIKNNVFNSVDLISGLVSMFILSIGIYFGFKVGMISSIVAIIAYGLYLFNEIVVKVNIGVFEIQNYLWLLIFPAFGYTGALFSNYIKRLSSDVNYLKQNLDGYMNADIITNYKNAQWFYDELEGDMAKAKRHGLNFSLVLIEVKHMMEFAKYYGYFRTEDLLSRIAEKINELTRTSDKKFVIEKDRFALILPSTDSYGAQILKLRISENLKLIEGELNIKGRKPILDFRLGYMEYDEHIDSPQKFVSKLKKEIDKDYLERNDDDKYSVK